MSALAKYADYHAANPTEGQMYGWFTAQAMIEGLKVAGKNPTWGSFITNLRKVTNYTANGALAAINFSKFGNVDEAAAGGSGSGKGLSCWYQSVVKGNQFVALSAQPFCGTQVPGSSNITTPG
jgi:hypothetical protein